MRGRQTRVIGAIAATAAIVLSFSLSQPAAASRPRAVTAPTAHTESATTAPVSGAYSPVTPYRVCDTRPAGNGVPVNQCNDDSTGAGRGPLTKGATRVITVDTFGGLPPSGVTAVVVNVTAVAPSLNTYLSIFPDGVANPGTSNLNPSAGTALANLVEVGVSTAGKIDVYNAVGTVNVVLDIEGYVSATSMGLYTSTTPLRICDTRPPGDGIIANRCDSGVPSPIGQDSVRTFAVSGMGSPVPTSGVSAVVFNLTAINPSVSTVLTAFAAGTGKPNASNLNLVAHSALPNRVIVPVTCTGGACSVSIWNGAGSVNIAVDLDGWFTTTTGTQFTPLASPARICDTQGGTPSCAKAKLGGGDVLNVEAAGVDGIPDDTGGPGSLVAIVANVTAFNGTSPTFVTVYPGPDSPTHPGVSDLNPGINVAATNLVVVGVGSDGSVNLYNATGSVNLIVDVLGYYATAGSEPPGATYSSTIGGPGHAAMYASGMEIVPQGATNAGDIVIADTGNNQVAEYTTGGTEVWRVGSEGSGASTTNIQFEQPRDVGVDSSGNVYVADNGNGRVMELSPTGTFIRKWKTEQTGTPGAPIGITVSTTTADLPNLPAGQRVYVSDGTQSQITVWNTDGTPVSPAAAATITDTTGPCALDRMRDAAADAAGNVYVANYESNNIVEFTWDGSAWTCANSFGTKGTQSTTGVCSGNGNGAFKNPYGVAIGTDPYVNGGAPGEAIYVADSNDDCIQEFTPDGTWVANIGGPGIDSQPGTFSQLRRVAVDSAGNVWGADLWGNRLVEFSPTSLGTYAYAQTLPNPIVPPGMTSTSVFNQVRGIGFDSSGDTVAMDTVNQRVDVFDPSGNLINVCGQRGFSDVGDFNWPRGVAVDPMTGNYWIADTKQSDIQILQPIASPAMSGCNSVGYVTQTLGDGAGDVDYPDSIAISGGYAWVADTRNNRIDSWNVATQAPVSNFGTVGSGTDQFQSPTSVTVDPTTGDLFVADSGNNRVVELSVSSGTVVSTVATYTSGISDPYGAASNGAGLLAVANRDNDQVIILNESDSSVFATITGGDVTGGGPTALSDPENVTFGPGGNLYIADTYNDRILVYSIST